MALGDNDPFYYEKHPDALRSERAFREHRPTGKPRGRPRLPLSERKVQLCVSMRPADADYVAALDGNNLSGGIAKVVEFHRAAKQAALDAIKAAAERRDQAAVTERSAFDD